MAQGRSSYQAEDGLHHTSDDPNAQFTPHQPQYDQGFMGMDLFKDSNILLDQLISANAGIHGQQTHAGTTPTLISSPGNQSATASSAFTSPHLTTPPTSYDHQPFPNNISLVPLFSSPSASTAPQGGHVPINAFEQGYSGSSSSTAFPPLFTTNAPVAGPSRPRSLSPASAHPLLGAIHSSEEHEVSIDALLRQCDQKDMESRLTDYSNFAFNPQLQMEWLRIVYNWVVREVEPSREDHFHFLSAHHAPITQKTGGPGSRGGAQAYTCLWPGCGKELKSRADRAQEHILEHLEIKPFLCANCNIASFLRKNDCSRHEKTCKTSSTSSKGIKRKTGARGAAPYPELNTRRTNATRTSSPSASRSATDSPIARMNLLQMSPLHMTSPLSPSSVSPQQFFMADAVPSSSPTQTRYAEAQLQSPLRGYPMQLPAASSSVPVAGANGLLFQHMPPSMMPSPHHPSYSMPTFNQFDVQRSLPSSLPYHYPNSNGSNDSFMPMQGSSDSHQPFPHM